MASHCSDAYMEQWLKTATKGNVRFTMAFLANRMHLHCDVCNVGLTCEKPVDANTIDYAVQEYVKLHAHTGGHGDVLWAKSQLKQVPTVVEHTPPPPKSAPVSDVFEDKGRKFR